MKSIKKEANERLVFLRNSYTKMSLNILTALNMKTSFASSWNIMNKVSNLIWLILSRRMLKEIYEQIS